MNCCQQPWPAQSHSSAEHFPRDAGAGSAAVTSAQLHGLRTMRSQMTASCCPQGEGLCIWVPLGSSVRYVLNLNVVRNSCSIFCVMEKCLQTHKWISKLLRSGLNTKPLGMQANEEMGVHLGTCLYRVKGVKFVFIHLDQCFILELLFHNCTSRASAYMI